MGVQYLVQLKLPKELDDKVMRKLAETKSLYSKVSKNGIILDAIERGLKYLSKKTLVACQAALDLLFNKEIEKIIVARPVVTAKEDIGFLPGGLKDKLDPFIAPIYDNMYRLYNKEKIDKEFAEGRIEIIPFAFMRGRNFSNSFIILDEAQNITDSQMELAITRLCEGSKMCIVGDVGQIDLKFKKDSGLYFVSKAVAAIDGVSHFHLKTNHRHPIVEPILEIYKTLRD